MSNVVDFESYKRIRDAERDIRSLQVEGSFTNEEISALLDVCYSMKFDPEAADKDWQEGVYGVDVIDSLDSFGFTLTLTDDEDNI